MERVILRSKFYFVSLMVYMMQHHLKYASPFQERIKIISISLGN
jgi:hypothetical protein